MANLDQEPCLSLRREAKGLLHDATLVSDASVRRALLRRAYALVRQAEIVRAERSLRVPAAKDFLALEAVAADAVLTSVLAPQAMSPSGRTSEPLSATQANARAWRQAAK